MSLEVSSVTLKGIKPEKMNAILPQHSDVRRRFYQEMHSVWYMCQLNKADKKDRIKVKSTPRYSLIWSQLKYKNKNISRVCFTTITYYGVNCRHRILMTCLKHSSSRLHSEKWSVRVSSLVILIFLLINKAFPNVKHELLSNFDLSPKTNNTVKWF